MRVRFDPDADALYIRLAEGKVSESAEVSPGIVLDYDAESRVVGIEVLEAGKLMSASELRRIDFEVA